MYIDDGYEKILSYGCLYHVDDGSCPTHMMTVAAWSRVPQMSWDMFTQLFTASGQSCYSLKDFEKVSWNGEYINDAMLSICSHVLFLAWG